MTGTVCLQSVSCTEARLNVSAQSQIITKTTEILQIQKKTKAIN